MKLKKGVKPKELSNKSLGIIKRSNDLEIVNCETVIITRKNKIKKLKEENEKIDRVLKYRMKSNKFRHWDVYFKQKGKTGD